MLLCATLAMPLHSHAIILPLIPRVKKTFLPLLLNEIEESDLKEYIREFLPPGNLYFSKDTQPLLYNDWFFQQLGKAVSFTKLHKKEVIIVVVIAMTIALVVIITLSLVEAASAAGALAAAATEALANDAGVDGPRLPPEEEGRILGSLIAHEQIETAGLTPEDSYSKHRAIDEALSTNYTPLYTDNTEKPSLSARYYQSTAEKAYEFGYYDQTLYNSNKAIELDPSYPTPYFDRSMANFELNQYDAALSDYHTFVTQTQDHPSFSVSEFSAGFAKGLPKGVYESGCALVEFTSSAALHPIQTGQQVRDSLILLSDLVHSEEWTTLAETLAPEVHQLITDWDDLSSTERGELAGYAFGKYGADIVIPGAAGKAIVKGTKAAKRLNQARAGCEIAERVLVLESTAAEATLVTEAIESTAVTKRPSLKPLPDKASETWKQVQAESIDQFKKVESVLKAYKGQFFTETTARNILHEAGFETFPKPKNLPNSFRVQLSDKGGGMKYVHPDHSYESVRVMPGKPHSQNVYQQKPYITHHTKDGLAYDKYGNKVSQDSIEAHIPLKEFVYRPDVTR